MKKVFNYIILAALTCCVTVTYAQGDYDKYEKDNQTYGTTPFINLSDMPQLYNCMPAHPSFDSPEFSADMVRYLWGKQQREDAERVAVDSVPHIKAAKKAIRKAFENQKAGKGFSIVEVLSTCPTNWGLAPLDAIKRLQDEMIPYYPLGVYKDVEEGVFPAEGGNE